MVSARLSFMTRLAKKRGITQDGEDKSLILRYCEKAVGLEWHTLEY